MKTHIRLRDGIQRCFVPPRLLGHILTFPQDDPLCEIFGRDLVRRTQGSQAL